MMDLWIVCRYGFHISDVSFVVSCALSPYWFVPVAQISRTPKSCVFFRAHFFYFFVIYSVDTCYATFFVIFIEELRGLVGFLLAIWALKLGLV